MPEDKLTVLPPTELVPVVDEETDEDFKIAREAIKSSIEQASEAVPGLIDLADQSQHPRSYEVLGQFLKMKSELGRDLIEVTEKRVKNREKRNGGQAGNQTINNNLILTTAELQKLMKDGG